TKKSKSFADNTIKEFSYIVKVNIQVEAINFSDFNLFPKEIEMYSKYLPAFEQIYNDSGVPVTFGAKFFRLKKDVDVEYLILENLQSKGFKMCDRMKGLDLEHSKDSLKKLAQWHAASLKYKELNGPYPPKYQQGMFTKKTADAFKSLFSQSKNSFLKVVEKFDGVQEYLHKLPSILDSHVDKMVEDAEINEDDFNVLNHGDAWLNNIMFKYDSEGRLEETFLIDHQVSKYGSPAQDLYYFIMSSTQLDIKVDQFDYLIKWYHENLVEHTRLLKYSGFVPDLKELHTILLKHPVYGRIAKIYRPKYITNLFYENFSTERFLQTDEEGDILREALYSNERYRANIERIMPWLNRRGLLD
ncbi:hypothetical protein KR009_008708, partial [Drosophila setifemur]